MQNRTRWTDRDDVCDVWCLMHGFDGRHLCGSKVSPSTAQLNECDGVEDDCEEDGNDDLDEVSPWLPNWWTIWCPPMKCVCNDIRRALTELSIDKWLDFTWLYVWTAKKWTKWVMEKWSEISSCRVFDYRNRQPSFVRKALVHSVFLATWAERMRNHQEKGLLLIFWWIDSHIGHALDQELDQELKLSIGVLDERKLRQYSFTILRCIPISWQFPINIPEEFVSYAVFSRVNSLVIAVIDIDSGMVDMWLTVARVSVRLIHGIDHTTIQRLYLIT